MPGETICRVGPVESRTVDRYLYALLTDDGSVAEKTWAAEDVAGLLSLAAGRADPPACEPSLRAAAATLGLAVAEPTPEQNAGRADLALALADAELPRTDPPIRHRMFLQGAAALLASSSWKRLRDGQTALISVSGQYQDEHYNLGISLAAVAGAVPPKLLAMVTDFGEAMRGTIETAIWFEEGPAFVIEALGAAYELGVVPRIEVIEGPDVGALLRRYGPALGAAFYMLADLDLDQDRRTVRLEEDDAPMLLRISAGFGLDNAGDVFGPES